MEFPQVFLSLVSIASYTDDCAEFLVLFSYKYSKYRNKCAPHNDQKCRAAFSHFPYFLRAYSKLNQILYTYIYTLIYTYLLSNQRWWHITHPKSAKAIIFPSSTSTQRLKFSDPVTHKHISQQLLYTRNPHVTHHHPQHHTTYTIYTLVERANITSTTHLPKHKDKETSHQNWTIYTHTYIHTTQSGSTAIISMRTTRTKITKLICPQMATHFE